MDVPLYLHINKKSVDADDDELYFLNAEPQAKEQLVPFLQALVWLGRESNPQLLGYKTHTLPNEQMSYCAGLQVDTVPQITLGLCSDLICETLANLAVATNSQSQHKIFP